MFCESYRSLLTYAETLATIEPTHGKISLTCITRGWRSNTRHGLTAAGLQARKKRGWAQAEAVVLGARRTDRIELLADELIRGGGNALAVPTDVTDAKQVKMLVDAAVQKYGRIDVMLNNAGLMPHSPLERLKIDDWNRTIDVNIKGVLHGIAAALPYMKKQKSGHIISVSSVAGHKVRPGSAVYAASKNAVRVISEGLRQEVKPYNIRTTVISPGALATELPNSITEPDIARMSASSSMRSPFCRIVRASRCFRNEPAGGHGRERDRVPADPTRALNTT